MPTCRVCDEKYLQPKPSDNLKLSNDAEATEAGTSYAKKKELTIPANVLKGKIRVKFELHKDAGATSVEGRIYKNGAAIGTERTTTSEIYVAYTEDLEFMAGDLVQLYAKVTGSGTAYVKNFRIYVDSVCQLCGYNDSMLQKSSWA